VAADLLAASPLAAALQHDVLDGICLHLNPAVDSDQGVIQHLMHDGIVVDVVGFGAHRLDPAGIGRVMDRHPRHQFNLRGEPRLRAHGRRVHGCRAGALFAAGFGPALRIAPWVARERSEVPVGR
jgi:hypothetical protein